MDNKNDLSKREQIAAMAMQGLLSNAAFLETNLVSKFSTFISTVAQLSTQAADALLQELPRLILKPIFENEFLKIGELTLSYASIIDTIPFCPNINGDMFDHYLQRGSWAFKDQYNRKAFIWRYNNADENATCQDWNVGGDRELLDELFSGAIEYIVL